MSDFRGADCWVKWLGWCALLWLRVQLAGLADILEFLLPRYLSLQ